MPFTYQQKLSVLTIFLCRLFLVDNRMCKVTFLIYSNKQNPLTSLVEVVHKGGGWEERDRQLILWHFEELLKQRYKEFIEVLEVMITY